MLKGDLTSTPLAPLLRDLADDSATGCLHVTNPAGDEALIYFKNGLVYSVSVPGTRPQLGAKLVSSGALAPEALAEALEAQRSELQGWRLGELLVHLGYVDQPVVEAFVLEQVNEALWDLLRWSDGRWKFRKNIRAREDIGPPMVVVELLATLRDRGYEWENISAVVHGPAAVPMLSARGGGSAETTLDNDAWSMLCKIDGERSVADLARDCGYTLFEAGQVIVQLVQAGLVDIDEEIDIAGTELYGATTLSSALAGELDDVVSMESDETFDEVAAQAADDANEDPLARLARLVNEVAGDHSHNDGSNGDQPSAAEDEESAEAAQVVALAPPLSSGVTSFDNPMIVPLHRHSSESFAASIARVSNALSDVLGEAPDTTNVDNSPPKPVALKRGRSSTSDPEWQRRKRLRSAAAAELASAQAMVETLRADHDSSETELDDTTKPPPAEQIAERLAAEQAEAERLAAEAAEQAEIERIAAEQAEAERLAAAQAEADRVAAEEAEAAAEVERLAAEAAERAAIEELAWAEYWHLEGEERAAAEAERVALEEAAEAERVAAEEAAAQAEAERLAAEQAEAERLAAEEAERIAAEAAESERLAEAAAAQAEAERLAAEEAEAERIAAEEAEAERIAAEEAEAARLAAEEAERLAAEQAEAERIAAEEAEAARLAAEEAAAQAEAVRLAEEEAAAQAEAERLAAEEAERIAAEEAEAARLAAEEAEVLAAEQAEAERLAAEEAEQLAAEEAERLAAQEAAQLEAVQAELERAATEEAERMAALADGMGEPVQDVDEEDVNRAIGSAKADRARRRAEKQAAEEADRHADEAASATALLIELAASTAAEEPEVAVAEATQEESEADPIDDPDDISEAWTEAGQADTAALLRELSSLGMDDDEPSAPTAAAARQPRPAPADKKTKKKIGLFGR